MDEKRLQEIEAQARVYDLDNCDHARQRLELIAEVRRLRAALHDEFCPGTNTHHYKCPFSPNFYPVGSCGGGNCGLLTCVTCHPEHR
jgi:hypothetical protein